MNYKYEFRRMVSPPHPDAEPTCYWVIYVVFPDTGLRREITDESFPTRAEAEEWVRENPLCLQ